MSPPATRARIANIDARQVALDATKRVLEAYGAEIHDLFGAPFRMNVGDLERVDEPTLRKTPTYRMLRSIAEYGVQGGELALELEPTFEHLLPALRKLHILGHLPSDNPETTNPKSVATLDEFLAALDTFAFESELGAALVAAWARTQLAREKPVTANQLAVLAGLGNVSVGNAIRAGTLKAQRRFRDQTQKKGNPYLVKPAEARRFLQERQEALRADADS